MSKEMTEKSEKDGQGLKETNLKEKRKRVSRLGTSDVSHVKNLGQVGPLIRGMKLRLNVKKPKKLLQAARNMPPKEGLGLLCELRSGIWLIRLVSVRGNSFDHCILINAQEGKILDPAKWFPLKLSQSAVEVCGGKNEVRIAEVLEIYKYD